MKVVSKTRWLLRPRFSLAAMLVLITAVAIPLGYVAQRRAWNLRRAEVFADLFERRLWLFDAQNKPISIWDSSAPKSGWWASLLKEGSVPRVHRVFLNGVRRDGGPWDMSLSAADIGDAELLTLAYFPEIEHLDIQDCDRITDKGLRVVGHLPHLKMLWLRHCPNVKGAFLGDAPPVESLVLAINLDRSNAAALRRQTKLQQYAVMNAPLQDDDLSFLANCTELEELTLSGVPAQGAFLGKFPSGAALKILSLEVAPLTDSNAKELVRLENLVELHLGGTPITGEFLEGASWPKLESLWLNGSRFSEKGKTHLAALRGPKEIFYPSNWSAIDLRRYASGGAPTNVSLHPSFRGEAVSEEIKVTSYYLPENLLVPIDQCPPELMTEVRRLQELARAEATKQGWKEGKR